MNELLFRQLERMLKECHYQSSCHSPKELEQRVLKLTDDQLFEATQMMYKKRGNSYVPSFNFPNITFTFLEKGDTESSVFKSVKNRIIFWENFANEKPDLAEDRTFLEVILERDSELEKSEVEKIVALVMCSKGTHKFEDRKEMIISKYGLPSDGTVLTEGKFGMVYSKEVYKYCENETFRYFEENEGYCITDKNEDSVNYLKYLVLRHHSFEPIMFSLVYQLFATDCIYQGFIEDLALSIENRLEKCYLEYDFIEDLIKDRFEIYGQLDIEDEFEGGIIKDIILLEKILNIRPYPYSSNSFWVRDAKASFFSVKLKKL